MKTIKTQVGIIGAGPAGLLLGQMLYNRGIESVIIESRDREYVRARLRAGIQEQGTVDTFIAEGVAEKLQKEGVVHPGVYLHFEGEKHYLPVKTLTGRCVTAYGQRNITCDMIDIREANGLPLFFEAPAQALSGITDQDNSSAVIHYTYAGEECAIHCDWIAACDGYYGVGRASIPDHHKKIFEHIYPYSWFGILAEAPPKEKENIYAHSSSGFALQSMRGTSRSRLYIQVDPSTNLADWSDEQFFNAFEERIGAGYKVNRGEVIDRTLAHMRSFVCEPMRYGKLFLAGDAAHIVPPTGAKGLNLAVADIRVLAEGFKAFYKEQSSLELDNYSEKCLRRVWKVTHFSKWFTEISHLKNGQDEFATKLQTAALKSICDTDVGKHYYAENYVGLPFS